MTVMTEQMNNFVVRKFFVRGNQKVLYEIENGKYETVDTPQIELDHFVATFRPTRNHHLTVRLGGVHGEWNQGYLKNTGPDETAKYGRALWTREVREPLMSNLAISFCKI